MTTNYIPLLDRCVVALERIAKALEDIHPTEQTITIEPAVSHDMEAVIARMTAVIGKPGVSIRGDEA